jgi:hypothetical protein
LWLLSRGQVFAGPLAEGLLAGGPAVAARWRGADVLFNCIGTTRHAAGSAQAFAAVEVPH